MNKIAKFIGITLLAVTLGACSEDVTSEPAEKEPVTEIKKESKPPKEKPKASEEDEQKMLEELQAAITGSDVTFNKKLKMYTIELEGDQMIYEIASMESGEMSKESWYNLVDQTKETSEHIKSKLGSGYSVALTNPANPDKSILLIMDGMVIYDIFPRDM